VDDTGNLLSGGHHDKDRMTDMACELGGHVRLGLSAGTKMEGSTPMESTTTSPPATATITAQPEWSCRACGDAYFGTAPEHRHCPACILTGRLW